MVRDAAGKPYTVRYEAVNAMLLNLVSRSNIHTYLKSPACSCVSITLPASS